MHLLFLSRSSLRTNAILAICIASVSWAAAKEPLTPEACTQIRYLAKDEVSGGSPLRISPDATRVAYLAQSPDVATNTNEVELFVKPITKEDNSISHPVFVNSLIAGVSWFPDNRTVAALIRRNGTVVLATIDTITASIRVIWQAPNDISDYSMDSAARTIAVAVKDARPVAASSKIAPDETRGYRIDLATVVHSQVPTRQVFVLTRILDHEWTVNGPIRFRSPLSGKVISHMADSNSMHISLSPNGHLLLLDNIEGFADVPAGSAWATNYGIRYEKRRGSAGLVVSYLYDLAKKNATMPLASPYVTEAVWAPDSGSYLEIALAPVGSTWETADFAKNIPTVHMTHLFEVTLRPAIAVNEVLSRAERLPIAWTKDGNIILTTPEHAFTTLHKEQTHWREIGSVSNPLTDAAPFTPLTCDGSYVVMEYENAGTAPVIVALNLTDGHTWTISRLNPQVDRLLLPKTETITWQTTTGYTATGLLLLPPDYDARHRYPLVIEMGSVLYSGEFVCDSGIAHVSSFARGILADAGIVYLVRYWPGIGDWESNYYPEGYPGYIAEAAFKQDLTESAVNLLDKRGVVDATKVGLIGFSRGGWYVDYILTHSHMRFLAASTTDNTQYSVGEYWLWNNEQMARVGEGMYDGPPYGPSLRHWLDYSISFNLDKVYTPLLMEVNGYGKRYDLPDQPPDNVAVHNEIFVGLKMLHKPVEYYYYPYEEHEPEHPQARIASLWRNVDWFRFWLEGYERGNPEDPGQYDRWRQWRSTVR